jgi:hypothetical protein
MSVFEKRPLERVRYWQGQMLRSADFRAQSADTAQHRWWHNRALHNAYGVYQGLSASAAQDSAGLFVGVTIAAGVGYDCFGRELIVDAPQTIALPANVPQGAVTMVLLITYAVGEDTDRESMQEICWTTTPTESTVTFVWKTLNCVHLCDGVPLAHVIYDGQGGSVLDPSFVPPGSRPIARPSIASGATLPSTTTWEPWLVTPPSPAGVPSEPVFVGAQTSIDTSDAGFTGRPCYFAWLKGPLFNRRSRRLLPDMFTSLADETPNGFTFRLWIPPTPEQRNIQLVADIEDFQSFTNFTSFARQQQLYVQWVACQMPPTVPFVPLRLRLLNAFLLPLVLQKVVQLRTLLK